MTKEPIMIDGVDVSECEFAVKPINDNEIKCHCCKGLLQIATMHEQPESIRSGLCENNPNCYYKQLKRLENEYEGFAVKYTDMEIALKAKEQECEFWKKELDKTHLLMLKRQDELVKEILKNDQLKAENDDLKKSILQECPNCGEEYLNYKGVELYDENNQLKQALQEIKELVKKDYCSEIESCEFCAEIGNCINRKILQKCEVIDG